MIKYFYADKHSNKKRVDGRQNFVYIIQYNHQMEPDKKDKLTYTSVAGFVSKTRQLLKEEESYEIELFEEMTKNKSMA